MKLAIALMSFIAINALAARYDYDTANKMITELQKNLTQKISAFEGDYVLVKTDGKTAGFTFNRYGGPAIWVGDSRDQQRAHTKQDEMETIAKFCPQTAKARISKDFFEIRSEGNYVNSINLESVAYNHIHNRYDTMISENGRALSISDINDRAAVTSAYSVFTFNSDLMVLESNFDGYAATFLGAVFSSGPFVKCTYRLQR